MTFGLPIVWYLRHLREPVRDDFWITDRLVSASSSAACEIPVTLTVMKSPRGSNTVVPLANLKRRRKKNAK
jgi:hypothetical protein